MNDMRQLISLCETVQKNTNTLLEAAPPGKKAERFIKHQKAEFRERYGKNWFRHYLRLVEADAALSGPTAPHAALSAQAAKFVDRYPDQISPEIEPLISALEQHAMSGARFRWSIVQLPDGRYMIGPGGDNFGLPVVKDGRSDDFER